MYSMKVFEHEGTAYVCFFSENADPVTMTVDKALSYCHVHANENQIQSFDADHVFGELVTITKVFSWSTPNLAQAILQERGAKRMIEDINYINNRKKEVA